MSPLDERAAAQHRASSSGFCTPAFVPSSHSEFRNPHSAIIFYPEPFTLYPNPIPRLSVLVPPAFLQYNGLTNLSR